MLLVLLPLLIHAEFPRGACGPSPLPLRVIPPPNTSAAVERPVASWHECQPAQIDYQEWTRERVPRFGGRHLFRPLDFLIPAV
jgi:hypothetical protein